MTEKQQSGKLGDLWRKWRESRRQYQIERALYKAGGNPTGPFAREGRAVDMAERAAGAPRVEAPKSKGPDPTAK